MTNRRGWMVLLAFCWAAPAPSRAHTLLAHGQSRFKTEAALFYGQPLGHWLAKATGCGVGGGAFASPQAFLSAIGATGGPLSVVVSTHMVGQGRESALWVGNGPLSASALVAALESRQTPYQLVLDACYTGFDPGPLAHGKVVLAQKGQDVEDDALGATLLGEALLQRLGAPAWGPVKKLPHLPPLACRLPLLKVGGSARATPAPHTRAAAQAVCVGQGLALCGYAHWRSQPLGQIPALCGGSRAPEWLADDTGEGRALLWLGCQGRGDGKRFGARLPHVASPEVGFRCCAPPEGERPAGTTKRFSGE